MIAGESRRADLRWDTNALERSALCAALMGQGNGTRPDLFLIPKHRMVAETLASLPPVAGEDVNDRIIRVATALRQGGHADKENWHSFVGDLLDAPPSTAAADFLETYARAAELDRLGDEIHLYTRSTAAGSDPITAVADIEEKIQKALANRIAFGALPSEDLADVLARPIPDTPWAARGLISKGDIGIISGPGGIGKSWIALALGLDLAAGRTALGRFPVDRPYRIAVVDLESRPWEADQRLHRIVNGCGLDAEKLRGMVRVVRPRIRFDKPQDVRSLLASIREWGSDFVILDSFRRLHGGDENRSETISALFLDAFDMLRSETGAGAIVIDHHRKPTGESALDGPESALRGSTDKRNMVDWHVGIEARQEHLAFIPTKTRHSKLPDPFKLELAGLSEDAPEDGPVAVRHAGDLDRASDKVQDAIVALLQDAGVAGLLRGELVGRSGYSARATDEALRSLKGRDRIRGFVNRCVNEIRRPLPFRSS